MHAIANSSSVFVGRTNPPTKEVIEAHRAAGLIVIGDYVIPVRKIAEFVYPQPIEVRKRKESKLPQLEYDTEQHFGFGVGFYRSNTLCYLYLLQSAEETDAEITEEYLRIMQVVQQEKVNYERS